MDLDGQSGSWMEVDAEHIRLDLQNGRPPGLYYYQVTGGNLSLANADPYGNPCVARRS
jgi:hypothetical protein